MGRKRGHPSLQKITQEEYVAHLPHLFYKDHFRTPYMEDLYSYCVAHNDYMDLTILLYIADHQAEFLPHIQDKKTGAITFPYDYEHLLKTVRHHMLSEEELDQHYDEKVLAQQQEEGQRKTEAEINHYINLVPTTKYKDE